MDYLSKTLPTYVRKTSHYEQVYRWDEVEWDEYEDKPYVMSGGEAVTVESGDDVPAKWWTVAVYTTYQVYGGPEEGGWHYSAGSLTEHGRVRFFDDYDAAQEYGYKLWEWVGEQNANRDRGDEKLTVRCTTEALPETHYPKKRPYYS